MGDVPSELRYIGTYPDSLFSGRPLAPGDYLKREDLDLDREASEDRRLLDDGLLIDANPPKQEAPAPPLEGDALNDALEARGILHGNKSKGADEKRALLAQHDAEQGEGE